MSKFKVIIAGGGPVGLTAAHALSKAGIDFVVLEGRPEVVEDVGASLVLSPNSLRVFAQLGLLGQLRELGHEVLKWADYDSKGLYSRFEPSFWVHKNFGQSSLMCHRAELVRCIYEGLSEADLARVHVNKRVAAVDTTEDGVVVTCEDGSTYAGDIVLGADGVHSKVRRIMREKALKADPASEAELDAESPFPAVYKLLFCTIPRQYDFMPGDHHVTHCNGASVQFLNASRRGWIFLYEKLEKPTTERVRYTDADMEAYAARHGDMMVGGIVPLRELMKQRTKGGMANLEEGVLKRWSLGGRIVLAGDSCHKYTPNAGQGLNNGIQDIVALVNELYGLVHTATTGPAPSATELTRAFERYQAGRAEGIVNDLKFSAHMTRLWAWPNWIYWFMDQWVMPNIPYWPYISTNWLLCSSLAKGLVLDFLEGEEPFAGIMPWAHPMPKPKAIC